MQRSVTGHVLDALELSLPALVYDSAGRAGDPFFRATLHLQRGEWHAALGQRQAADSSWLWYENLDAVGWPSTVSQACEVDWALGTYGRWRRARLADSSGAHREACLGMAQVAELWTKADPAYEPWVKQARELLRRCPQ